MSRQDVIEGMEGVGVKLRLSFGGMQTVADREPELRDPVYMVIAGHFSKIGEAPGEGDFVVATVVGVPHLISQLQFLAVTGGRPAPMWGDDDDPGAGEKEAAGE